MNEWRLPTGQWRARVLDETTKGLRLAPGQQIDPAEVSLLGWNALKGHLDYPALVLHEDALLWNVATMRDYCAAARVELAPHAKTSMSPELVRLQLEAGAWAVTAATPSQVRSLYAFGVRRILLANVVVDPAFVEWVIAHLLEDDTAAFMCYVDSLEGVDLLEKCFASSGADGQLRLLLEVGYAGGRSGTRSLEDGLAIAQRVQVSPWLRLIGVAGFEGLVPGPDAESVLDACGAFLGRIHQIAELLHAENLIDQAAPTVVTVGGSSYFDEVVRELAPSRFSFPVVTVLRSGCYVTHDHGVYAETSPLAGRCSTGANPSLLKPALELLAHVWSRPEPDLVIAGFGRRDVPTDDRMPVVLRVHSALDGVGSARGFRVLGVNDQHAFISVPSESQVAVGDTLGLGVSHPCGAFDRWQFIPVVSPSYDVVSGVTTCF